MALLLILCEFLAGAGVVSRAGIERAVEQYVHEHYRGTATEATVEFRSVPDAVPVREKEYTLRVDGSGIPVLAGNVSLPVEVVLRGQVDERCLVSVKVRTFDTVLVTTKQLGRHELLTPQDVRRERGETTDLKGLPLSGSEQLIRLWTARIIGAGSVLTRDLVRKVPDVLQGATVTIVVRGKNFRLSLDGVAKEDGLIGQRVTVQRTGSNVRVQGLLLDPKTVEVQVQ